jgi:predicted ATPase/DNA-binding winged helix-turn-helix (wHTH) protein
LTPARLLGLLLRWTLKPTGEAMAEYRFDRFVVEPERRRLLIDGAQAKIGARAFDVLLALIEKRRRLATKQELFEQVWPNVTVEEGNLQVQIFALRKLLGADAIVTIPGHGYQFTVLIEGDEASADSLAPTPIPHTSRALRGNLPLLPPSLYGREKDAAALKALIAKHRLVSVVGPGGIGKTRLVQLLAHEWRGVERDGVWLVELATIETAELTAPTVAQVMGHVIGPRENPLDSLAEALRDRELLLVLDSCEHVIDAVADLASAVLAQAPNIRLLITSQEPSRLAEEQTYRLGPLSVPTEADLNVAIGHGAVALFVARAQSADAHFALEEDNVGAVVETCARLDGVPLAIELAAARVALLGVHGVRRMLDERLLLLAGGSREAPARQRALSATLEWSYGLLSDDEQYVLDQLGVFIGSFSLPLALALLSDERIHAWAALEHLSTLIEKSLVMVEPGEPPRYRLLESTRSFALQRMAAKGLTIATRRKLALALAAALRSGGFKRSPLALAASFAPDVAHLRAATAWATGPDGDREIAIELAAESSHVWYAVGANDEGANLFRTVEPWVDASTRRALAARFWLSRSRLYSAAIRTVAEEAMKAADTFRALGDRELLFNALLNATLQFNRSGHPDAAKTALAEAKMLIDPSWPRWTCVAYEFAVGSLHYWTSEPERARARLIEALELNSGDDGDTAQREQIELLLLGCDLVLRRSFDVVRSGRDMLERERPPLRGFNRAVTQCFVVAALAQIGELTKAESALRAALPQVRRALGTARTTLCYIAFLAAQQGRHVEAAQLVGAIDALQPPGSMILAPPNRACLEEASALALEALGESAFHRLVQEGRALSEDSAVALGLPARLS